MKDPKRVEAGRKAYQTYKRNAQARPSTTRAYIAELRELARRKVAEAQSTEGR